MRKILIFLLVLTLLCGSASAATLTVDDSGGKQYKTIQSAVNAAKSGDTIYVHAGTYPETVKIDRPDMLLNFQGEKTSTCYKYPSVYGFSFWGPASGNINGFNITETGICYDVIGNNIIRNNYIRGGGVSIGGQTCSNNTIMNNQFFNCGISLYESYDNSITGNTINKAAVGIDLQECATCTKLTGNTFSSCKIGVQVVGSKPSYLIGNKYPGTSLQVNVIPS